MAKANNPLRYDPAGLGKQAAAFTKDLASRVKSVGLELTALLADPHLLELRSAAIAPALGSPVVNSLNDFRNDPTLLSRFREVAQGIIRKHLFGKSLRSLLRPASYWWQKYTSAARSKGYTDAQNRVGGALHLPFGSLGVKSREATAKALLMVERQLTFILGFSNRLGSEVESILSSAVLGVGTVLEVIKKIGAVIKDFMGRQARRLARHELQAEYASGQLEAFGDAGISEVVLEAELVTAGDELVCPICQAKSGHRYTLVEAEGIIPLHIGCRCTWVAVVVGGVLG